ncbi:hypothetical protein DPMN_095000 [Dreissena polymorpha]|uniref:Uncharacterized protein n=1 Tax=Dreissena polymorpha TaxID=45954 RepID=A0A9D4L6R5_DREPO|nr:hypothetical protein DPMN_095000 [Dreissena polymorpha]
MEGAGLKNILETVYGENAIVTGKDVQRALRGHFLVEKCLHRQLISEITKDPEIQILLDQAEELYSSLLRCETTIADATCSEILIKLNTAIERKKHELAKTSKTSKLWLNYKLMVSIASMLIKADSSGR